MADQSQESGFALSVSGKIGAGFAIVLVLHLSIVALGHYGLARAEADRAAQERLRTQVETLYQLDHAVGELQRNVLLYAFSGYRGPEHRVVELQDELGRLLKSVKSGPANAVVDPEVLTLMVSGLKTHREIFASVVTDRALRRTLVDEELAGLAEQLEQSLAAAAAPGEGEPFAAALSAFKSAQLKAMQFVHSPDSVRVHAVKQSVAECAAQLGRVTAAGADRDRMIALLAKYESAFLRMVQVTRGYLHLVNVVLAGEAEEFRRLAETVRSQCLSHADQLSMHMADQSSRFRQANNFISAMTIVLGVFASWLIGRNVASSLNAITATLVNLSKGVRCRHIPGIGRRDELGRMAAAAQVFKDKAEQTEILLAEVTRMKDLERRLAHAQKMESVGQLAAGIAHEINTPLQCVTNNIEYLRREMDAVLGASNPQHARASESEIPEAIDEASEAVQRVVEIVHAMRCMSHPGASELAPTDVNQTIENAVKISRNHWKEHAEVKLDLQAELPQPMAVSSELNQVVLNLVVNAADAIGEKRGERGPLGQITITTRAESRHVSIEVADSGAGIPAEVLPKVFDPFFTTKEIGVGSGQGLALAYNAVVNRLGGTLDVDSVEGQGAAFHIRIPLQSRDTHAVLDHEAVCI
ncbi:Sensor protein ZraS [Posidoniimonas corsicana]|uniref:histidine kinase n=1 Tax=Posidoniimonas corsicana TaxID=1938618 RepID=A0A5C5VIW3_9BACT|nr:ATP-binding protein [Posidoniimonas corsicana]TWT37860.1 Sensor protein ZraS [Posidoniimonas corsicana]